MKTNKLFAIILTCIFTLSAFAQEQFLGKVKNFNNEAVTDAIIYVDGKKTDVTTNMRGYFQVQIPKETKAITVLSKTYGLLTAEYTGQKSLSFMYMDPKLEADGRLAMNEDDPNKVSIGYTSVDKKDSAFTTTETQFSNQDDPQSFNTIYDLIRARLKGVRVTGNNRIIIRGVTGFGGTDPLFVVNGQIVQSIDFVMPVEVKKVNVLKGAAASIYGTRGANGVIEITLKS